MTSNSISSNQFRSTTVFGTFNNLDTSTKNILADGKFQRNLSVGGNLILGTETLDTNGNAIDSASNIQFTLQKTLYNIPLKTLSYINNLSSDVQQQINTITNTGSNNNFTDINFTGNINSIGKSTLDYIKNVTSDIQTQFNNSNTNISTIEYRTRDISWTYGVSNKTTISNYCNTSILSFSQTLNNISTTTFGYLSGLTSNIQQQINNIAGTPTGSVVAFAGLSSSLNGYLLCDGSYYSITQYATLYNVIGTTYGTQSGTFRVPNYQAVFLRGSGTQFVAQSTIGNQQGAPVGKNYTAPSIGTTLVDQSIQTTTNTLTPNIQVKTFVTGGTAMFAPSYTFQYSNAVSSISFDSTLDYTNYGNDNTFPVHTSVQYFIKY